MNGTNNFIFSEVTQKVLSILQQKAMQSPKTRQVVRKKKMEMMQKMEEEATLKRQLKVVK